MGIKINYLAFFFLFSQFSFAQWHWQNPVPYGNFIEDMQFTDSLHGFVCGYGGYFIRTSDGGNNWTAIATPEDEIIVDLFFLNNETGWILYYGTHRLYKTTNAGNEWNLVTDFPGRQAGLINFLDDQNGFAAGYTGPFSYLLKTTDGGLTWLEVTTIYSCYAIYFVNRNIGFAGSENKIFITTNGGLNWDPINLNVSIVEFTVYNIFALDQNHIYLVVLGTDFWGDSWYYFINTSNGGSNWNTLQFANTVSDVYFTNPTEGYLCADEILKTGDGGSTWQSTGIPSNGIEFSGNKSWSNHWNTLSFSDDGWLTAYPQIKSVTFSVTDGAAVDTNTAFACGYKTTILKTMDGGKNWEVAYSPGSDYTLNRIFINGSEIWSVGENGIILKSTDNGINWIQNTIANSTLNDITFTPEGTGFIGGSVNDLGVIYSSSDGGENWNLTLEFSDISNINQIKFARADLGWACGYPEAIYKTTDGGRNWGKVIDSIFNPVSIAVSGDTAWFSYRNRILITTNAGVTWESLKVFDLGTISIWDTDLDFINSKIGYEGTDDGRVFKTTDGGRTWIDDNFPPGNYSLSIDFVNEDVGWSFGWYGIILKRDPFYVSVKNYRHPLTQKFILYQNYPNPFNPVTTIKYQLPESGVVIIKVYDILGREIRTLVNQEKPSGIYKIEFDGSNLPSGIYFYRLQFDNEVKTKKILLLK